MSLVALLGIGAIGSHVAQNLLNANDEFVVYNRTADKAMPKICLQLDCNCSDFSSYSNRFNCFAYFVTHILTLFLYCGF